MSCGVLFIAKGEAFIQEAEFSAQQISSVMPGCPITLITNSRTGNSIFDKVIIDKSEYETPDKPRLLQATPYDKTLYIDSDMYIESSVSEIFEILETFDVAMTPDRAEDHIPTDDTGEPLDDVPNGFPEFNSGLIGYKSTQPVDNLLRDWERRCQPTHDYDQRSLRPALYHSDARFTPLPRRYNCMYHHSGHVTGAVKGFHGPLVNRRKYTIDLDKAVKKLNSDTGPRAYFGLKEDVFVQTSPSVFQKLRANFQSEGAARTAQIMLYKIQEKLKQIMNDTY